MTPAEASKAAFDETWEKVIAPGMNEALALIPKATAAVPSTVLHFTSASGFEAILRTRVLRLSRALASNDPMEMDHGLGIAEDLIRKRPTPHQSDRSFAGTLLNSLRGRDFHGSEHHLPDPHVCCFSEPECESSIPQWSMYGRGGSGLILVFDGKAMAEKEPVDFFPVTYERSKQEKRLQEVIEIASRTCVSAREYALRIAPEAVADRIQEFGTHPFGPVIAVHAATMKRSEFAFEHEWRLMVSTLPDVEPIGEQLKFGVDTGGPFLRSYFERPFAPADLKQVVIGSTHFDLNKPVVMALLDDLKYPSVDIRRGSVDLRLSDG